MPSPCLSRRSALPLLLLAAAFARRVQAAEPVVGGPCEGCETVFVGLPAELASEARIAPEAEPGEPMLLEGTVRRADGTPQAGVIVYAYHTDARGLYPPAEEAGGQRQRHGRLRGWVRTDAQGRYRFATIRPAGYPDSNIPQHIHMHVLEPGRCTYFIDDVEFEDDPRLQRGHGRQGRGGDGLVRPSREGAGPWLARRDIVLGERVPGYELCEAAAAGQDGAP